MLIAFFCLKSVFKATLGLQKSICSLARGSGLLGVGMNLGAQGGSAPRPGEAARAAGAGGGRSAPRGAGGAGTPQQPQAGAQPCLLLSSNPRSLSPSLAQTPRLAQSPVIQGALEAAETSPSFP